MWFIPFFLWSPSGQGKALRVSIDPGHGGRDKGAIHGQVRESNINLKIARKLYRRLKKDPDFEVLLLRKVDRDLELPTRLRMSRQFGSDLFISIHSNAHRNRRISGSELYIQQPGVFPKRLLTIHNGHRKKQKVSLVKSIGKKQKRAFQKKFRGTASGRDKIRENPKKGDLEKIISDLRQSGRLLESYELGSLVRKHWRQNKKRRIRQAPFFVLNQNSAPALLIEVGYLTNGPERRKLIQGKVQEAIAQKIHAALKDYAKNMDKLPGGLLKTGNVQIR